MLPNSVSGVLCFPDHFTEQITIRMKSVGIIYIIIEIRIRILMRNYHNLLDMNE
jgi:hypothetical protein